ncbi:hypothetical protein ACN4FV_11230, partial [Aliarcobacter butzleri]|uniref:hypothetical protein n=1 Tax=Aliarcobacter butzleri TaxID=28197 RepID=UPI003AF670DC
VTIFLFSLPLQQNKDLISTPSTPLFLIGGLKDNQKSLDLDKNFDTILKVQGSKDEDILYGCDERFNYHSIDQKVLI